MKNDEEKKRHIKTLDERRFPGVPPSVGQLLDRSVYKGRMYFLMQNQRIMDKFKLVVDPLVLEHASPYAYQFGVLYVRVDSPHYLERFRYSKNVWLKAINIEMGFDILTDINLKVLSQDPSVDNLPNSEFSSLSEAAIHFDAYFENFKYDE
jgi:hypothetical protein